MSFGTCEVFRYFCIYEKKGDYEMFTVYLKVMRNFGMFLTHFLFNSLLF